MTFDVVNVIKYLVIGKRESEDVLMFYHRYLKK
jgi:hypothetical protein